MPSLHCELEHRHVAAVIDIMFLKFLKRGTFRAMDWVFLLSSEEYFALYSICSSTGATLGTGSSLVSMTETWLMDCVLWILLSLIGLLITNWYCYCTALCMSITVVFSLW